MKDRIIVDIDGTLADATHRKHLVDGSQKKDWAKFYDMCDQDEPHYDIIEIVGELGRNKEVYLVTGRVERVREKTEEWLDEFDVPYDYLLMRPDGDYTPDHVLKIQMATKAGLSPDNVSVVLDDRTSVVNAWREAGYRCLQVAPGDF